MEDQNLQLIGRAKNRGVPLVCVRTDDPTVVIERVVEFLQEQEINVTTNKGTPEEKRVIMPTTAIIWTCSDGLTVVGTVEGDKQSKNPYARGQSWIDSLRPKKEEEDESSGPNPFAALNALAAPQDDRIGTDLSEALRLIRSTPPQSIIFIFMADRFLDDHDRANIPRIQSAALLRDPFKENKRMLVFLSQNDWDFPAELTDTLKIVDGRPTPMQILEGTFQTQSILRNAVPDTADQQRAAFSTSGMTQFMAEQSLYLSVNEGGEGMDLDHLRLLRHTDIDSNPGLEVWKKPIVFDDIGGVEYAKAELQRIGNGRKPVGCVIVMDEITSKVNKQSQSGDNTGISQDIHGTLLTEMEKNDDQGIIFFGVPGCSKSFLAQGWGNSLGVDTLLFDLGMMKQKYAGESGKMFRKTMDILKAISGGPRFIIGTCNSVNDIPSNLLRRFDYGTIFFDICDGDEKTAVWTSQRKAYEISGKQKNPEDINWTASDIRNCCRRAWNLDISLVEAAKGINPLFSQQPGYVDEIRRQAHGRYLSASTGKVYKYSDAKKKHDTVVSAAVSASTERDF